jgi:hypothetical protein
MMSMTSLILHSDHVPASARNALRAATEAPPADREALLTAAAQLLHDETGLECADVLELMDLGPSDCGCQ